MCIYIHTLVHCVHHSHMYYTCLHVYTCVCVYTCGYVYRVGTTIHSKPQWKHKLMFFTFTQHNMVIVCNVTTIMY